MLPSSRNFNSSKAATKFKAEISPPEFGTRRIFFDLLPEISKHQVRLLHCDIRYLLQPRVLHLVQELSGLEISIPTSALCSVLWPTPIHGTSQTGERVGL
ncbi:hypothetical protein Dimus_023531 [Dionaea muscipula]